MSDELTGAVAALVAEAFADEPEPDVTEMSDAQALDSLRQTTAKLAQLMGKDPHAPTAARDAEAFASAWLGRPAAETPDVELAQERADPAERQLRETVEATVRGFA